MSYDDFILNGSINGIGFKTKARGGVIGRRVAVNEYPQRSRPSTQDMGRKAREWRFTAFVAGPDYMGERDDLINELELPGPYTLVDPYGGEEYSVVLKADVNFREDTKRGKAEFDLHFVESGEEELFPSVIDAADETVDAGAAVVLALQGDFASKFVSGGSAPLPLGVEVNFNTGGLLASAANVVSSMTGSLRSVRGKITARINRVENLTNQIRSFDDEIESLLQTPRLFVSTFAGLIAAILGLFKGSSEPEAVKAARGAVRELFDFPESLPAVNGQTPTRVQQRANQAELGRVFRCAALAEAGAVFADLPYKTGAEAAEVQADLDAYFDVVLDDDATSDDLYTAIIELRAYLAQHFEDLARALPALQVVEFGRSRPSLVVAHAIYGDVEREAELIEINAIANPCFAPATIQAVVDG